MKNLLTRLLLSDTSGATAVEFAILAIPFFTVLMGVMEFGLFTFTQVTLEAAVSQAGRATAVSTNADRIGLITQTIKHKTAGLPNASGIFIAVNYLNTNATGGTPAKDICYENGMDQPPTSSPSTCGTPIPCKGHTWFDTNGNGKFDCAADDTDDQVDEAGRNVEIKATIPWQVMFPIMKSHFGNGTGIIPITSTTVVHNE